MDNSLISSIICFIISNNTIESNIAYFINILGKGLKFQLLYYKDLSNVMFKYFLHNLDKPIEILVLLITLYAYYVSKKFTN